MSIRWRKTGEMICAAMCDELPDDIYICDTMHYELSVIQKVLVADLKHEENGLWHWLHGHYGVEARSRFEFNPNDARVPHSGNPASILEGATP